MGLAGESSAKRRNSAASTSLVLGHQQESTLAVVGACFHSPIPNMSANTTKAKLTIAGIRLPLAGLFESMHFPFRGQQENTSRGTGTVRACRVGNMGNIKNASAQLLCAD